MEEEQVNLSNYPNCTDLSLLNGYKKVYESLYNKYGTFDSKSIRNNQKQKKGKTYFNHDSDNIKYFSEDINRENIKCNSVKERNIHLTDSNCVKNTNITCTENNVPLNIIIKQMVDKIFGKSSSTNNVNQDPVNLQNISDEINNSKQSLILIIKSEDDGIDSKTNTDNAVSSNETFCYTHNVKYDDKLISIEEESENSLSNNNTIENTGMHLSKLLKVDAESNNNGINKNNNITSLKDNNDNSAITTKISKDNFNSSVLFNIDKNEEEEQDDSFHFKDFVKMKSLPIDQETNIDNKFVALDIMNDSTNNLSFEENEDQTMNIFNISFDKNIVEKKESFHEKSNLSKSEEIKEISSFDDNSINIDPSKKKPKFINEENINLQTSYKRHHAYTTLDHISLPKPKSSMNTNTVTPRKNYAVLTNKPIKHANISSTDFANSSKNRKTSKIPPKPPKLQLQNRATKQFKSHYMNKKQQILIPQLKITPASPE